MEYLLGKPVADELKAQVLEKVNSLSRHPKIVILLNEEDASSRGYANAIIKNATSVNIDSEIIEVAQDEASYLNLIDAINKDPKIDAVLITRPLKKGLDENKIIGALDPDKDVDAINPQALGRLISGDESLVPNTPLAMIKMLEYYKIPLQGKKCLVVGRSLSVGKPMGLLLLNRNATVTYAHSKTVNLQEELKNYDIVVGALGKPEFLDAKNMKDGAVAIDAGIHYLEDRICGDIKADDKLAYQSKVPGGVGVVTNACLMNNVVSCYLKKGNR